MIQSLKSIFVERKFFLLLLALILFTILFPLVHLEGRLNQFLFDIFFLLLLASSLRATIENKQRLLILLGLGLGGLGIRFIDYFFPAPFFGILHLLILILFLVYLTWIVLTFVLRNGKVTASKIDGAICVYFFFGFIWTLLYCLIEYLAPHSFNLPETAYDVQLGGSHIQHIVSFLYYSLVTLTTLGYGDITPLSPFARMLSGLEAVTGQMYVAVLIARLVGLQIAHSKEGSN